MLTGSIYLTTDMDLAMKLATNHKIICVSGETHNYQQFINYTNATVASILLPPYEASSAEVNGDLFNFKQIYYNHLETTCMEFLAIIIRALYNGDNLLIFLTEDELKMNYIKCFSEFMKDMFGIIIGFNNYQCVFNQQYNDYVLTVLLLSDLLHPVEFLQKLSNVNVLLMNNSVIIKLKELLNPFVLDTGFEAYQKYFIEYKRAMIANGNKILVDPIRKV